MCNYDIISVDKHKIRNGWEGFIARNFGVTPQIGAHNPLGYDEISYIVDSRGNKKPVKYEHLKNYEIPERFQEYIIKPPE